MLNQSLSQFYITTTGRVFLDLLIHYLLWVFVGIFVYLILRSSAYRKRKHTTPKDISAIYMLYLISLILASVIPLFSYLPLKYEHPVHFFLSIFFMVIISLSAVITLGYSIFFYDERKRYMLRINKEM